MYTIFGDNMNWYKKANSLWTILKKAYNVTENYPQNWGDCYQVNSTVALWLNKKINSNQFQIWQAEITLAETINDVEEDGIANLTDKPYHVVVFDSLSNDIYDFSNVLGNSSILEYTLLNKLSGQVDKKLLKLLG